MTTKGMEKTEGMRRRLSDKAGMREKIRGEIRRTRVELSWSSLIKNS